MSDATQLLPCPFCGKAAPMHTPHGQTWVIQCVGHARIEEHGFDEAIAAWNTRAPDAERDALRADLNNEMMRNVENAKIIMRCGEHALAMISRAERAEAELAEARAKIADMTASLDRARAEIRTAAKNWRKAEQEDVGKHSDCGQRTSTHDAYRAMAFECSLEIVEKQFALAEEQPR